MTVKEKEMATVPRWDASRVAAWAVAFNDRQAASASPTGGAGTGSTGRGTLPSKGVSDKQAVPKPWLKNKTPKPWQKKSSSPLPLRKAATSAEGGNASAEYAPFPRSPSMDGVPAASADRALPASAASSRALPTMCPSPHLSLPRGTDGKALVKLSAARLTRYCGGDAQLGGVAFAAVREAVARTNAAAEEKRRRVTDLLYGKALVKGLPPPRPPSQQPSPEDIPAGGVGGGGGSSGGGGSGGPEDVP